MAPGDESTGSTVVTHGLSCSSVREVSPDQGLNLCLLHRQVNSLPVNQQQSLRNSFNPYDEGLPWWLSG